MEQIYFILVLIFMGILGILSGIILAWYKISLKTVLILVCALLPVMVVLGTAWAVTLVYGLQLVGIEQYVLDRVIKTAIQSILLTAGTDISTILIGFGVAKKSGIGISQGF